MKIAAILLSSLSALSFNVDAAPTLSIKYCFDASVNQLHDGSYAASCSGYDTPIYTSTDLVNWTKTRDSIFNNIKANWKISAEIKQPYWATEISQLPNGRIAAYTTAIDQKTKQRCVALATADTLDSEFVAVPQCVVKSKTLEIIDPSYFRDDNGQGYLLYKTQRPNIYSKVYMVKVNVNGKPVGAHKLIAQASRKYWAGKVLESPSMVKHNGYYYLMFGGRPLTENYYTGFAMTKSLKKPFVKSPAPILMDTDTTSFHGHGSIYHDLNGNLKYTVHGKDKTTGHPLPNAYTFDVNVAIDGKLQIQQQ